MQTLQKQPWYDIAIKAAIFGIVMVIPLVFSPSFQSVFSMPKLIVLHIFTLALALLWGYKSLLEGKITYHKSRFNLCLAIYACISILTTIFSINIFTSFFGTYGNFIGLWTTLDLLFIAFCTAAFFRQKEEAVVLILASVFTATLVSFYSLAEYCGVFKQIFHWNQDPAERLFGTIGQSNHLGTYLGMNLLLGITLIPLFKKRVSKLLMAISLLLQLAVVILTGSRGAVIALILTTIAVLCLQVSQHESSIQKHFCKKIGLILGILAIVITLPILLWPYMQRTVLVQRTFQTFQFWEEGQIPDRLSWWKSSFQMIYDRPLLGFGLGTFRDAYNQYRRVDYKIPGPGDMQNLTTPETAHNEYLNLAATQGLLGLAAFLAIIVIVMRSLVQNIFKKRTPNALPSLSIFGAVLFYLIQMVVNFGVVSTLPLFFVLLGLGLAVSQKSSSKILLYQGFSKYFFSIFILVGSSIGFIAVMHQASADYFFKEAYRAQAQGQTGKVFDNCYEVTHHHPFEYAYYQSCGDLFLKVSHEAKNALSYLEVAEEYYTKALALNNHHPSTFFNLGVTRLQIFQYTKQKMLWDLAWSYFQKAADLAVNNPLYSYQTAQLYLKFSSSDAREKAKQSLNTTVQIQPDYKDAQSLLKTL